MALGEQISCFYLGFILGTLLTSVSCKTQYKKSDKLNTSNFTINYYFRMRIS